MRDLRALKSRLRVAMAVLLACGAASARGEGPPPIGPENVQGLEAWYRIESLHTLHSGDNTIMGWKDSSGRGHHLQVDQRSVKPLFVTQQINDKPALEVRGGSTFRVFQAFDLDDHTIFLVYRAKTPSRALFRSESDPRRGLILGDEGRLIQFQNGDTESRYAYNEPFAMGDDFAIVVLAREDGLLGCFWNGRDVSSATRFSDPVRVGTFFHLEHTEHALSDAGNLYLVEMVFFERALDSTERDGVTAYLSQKFGIEVASGAAAPGSATAVVPPEEAAGAEPQVRLTSHSEGDLNVPAFAIPWDEAGSVAAPFTRDVDDPSVIRCERDGTRARLVVSVPIVATAPRSELRLLVLQNGQRYLEGQAASGALEGPGATIDLDTELGLGAGDYFQIVATRDGEAGPVTLDEAGATLSLTLVDAVPAPVPAEPEAPAPPPDAG